MKSGKLLHISDSRSIYLHEFGEGEYISPDMEIAYRNVGKDYNLSFVQEDPVALSSGQISVLDATGKTKFHFPEAWLDTDYMKLQGLIEKGLVRTGS